MNMARLMLFLLFFSSFLILYRAQTVCIAINSNENLQCSYCNYTFYVNDITLFASTSLFAIGNCVAKSNTTYPTQSIYIYPSSTCGSACDGSLNNPYPSLYTAIIQSSFIASQYNTSQIDYYLMGSTHYITASQIAVNGPHLFKKINAAITMQPYPCGTPTKAGCFNPTDSPPTVYIKSDDLKFFITKTMRINGIIFDGSDGHLTTTTDTTGCMNTNKACCNENSIINAAMNTNTLSCAISGVTLATRTNLQMTLGLFNLFYEFDNPYTSIPSLFLNNAQFLNFYSIKEDSTGGLMAGIAVFFAFYNNLPGVLDVRNTMIIGGYYRFGMIIRTNDDSITHNSISSTSDTIKLDLNQSLSINSSMTFSNFSLLRYNIPKILYTDTASYGCLFYVDQIQGFLNITNSYVTLVPLIATGVAYINPDIYSSTFTLIINGLQVSNATSFYIMNLVSCYNTIFMNNLFQFNDVSQGYGFLISYNPLFTFKNSTVIGPPMSAHEFFSIESSKFMISNSTFRNLQTTTFPLFFIRTTTKIYVASDTQFASSKPSVVPYSNDEITIEYTLIDNCNFLIFTNEHSVLYFTIRHSILSNMAMNTTTAGVSLTCERAVLFDNMTIIEMTHREHFVTLFAGRNFTLQNCKILNSHLINFILLMVVIPLDYTLFPYVFCILRNNTFYNINIIKNIQNPALTEIVQFIESQPISRGFGFHYIMIENNTFEEILDTTQGADYLLYFSSGHSNMTNNNFTNIKMLEVARFFPRIPNSILWIYNNRFSMIKYYIQHFFVITIGYYVDQLFIDSSLFEAHLSLNYSSGLEFLNIGVFSITNTVLQNIQSQTGNALTVNTNSLKAFFVKNCRFYFNAGANNNGADIVLGVANMLNIDWKTVNLSNITYGIYNSTFDSAQASGSITLMDNGELLIYQSVFKHIIGDSGAVLNIGSTCNIFVAQISIYNISSDDNGGCFKMMTTTFTLRDSIISFAGSTQIGGIIIATETSDVRIYNITVNNTFSLKGGVVSTEDSNLTIFNSTFGFSNSSSQGGHFYLKKSYIVFNNVNLTNGISLTAGSIYGELVTLIFVNVRVTNCTCDLAKGLGTIHLIGSDERSSLTNLLCQDNVAMTGTCIFAKDIEIDIVNSQFIRNRAEVHSIIEIFFSSLNTEITITNSIFSLNNATSSVIKSKITNVIINQTVFELNIVQEALFLLDQVTLTLQTVDFYSPYAPETDVYIIYLTNSDYADIYDTNFYGNSSLGGIYCMSCIKLWLQEILIQDGIGTYGAGIRARSTSVYLTNVNLTNNTASQGGGGIYLEDSMIDIIDSIFTQNSVGSNNHGVGSDIYCNNAQIYKYQVLTLTIEDSNTNQLQGCSLYVTYSNLVLKNFDFRGRTDYSASALDCEDCIDVNITNTNFDNLKDETAVLLSNNYKQTTYLMIKDCDFSNCSTTQDGGFMNIIGDVNIFISYTNFIGGFAGLRGGAIYYENSANFSASYFNFLNVLFKNNAAQGNGGAIYTAYTLVGKDTNVTFSSNNASNGKDIYSFPSKLLIVQNTGEDISELQLYVGNKSFINDYLKKKFDVNPVFYTKSGNPFSFGILIIDDYNNVLDSETDTICEIKDVTSATAVDVENNIAKLSQGMAIFTRVSIVETSNTLYNFLVVYSGNNDYQNLNKSFNIFIQKCGRGEIFNENRCIACEENFYSLEPDPEYLSRVYLNRTLECDTCPGYAECPGGDKIIPNNGYWRLNENSSTIVKCYPPESCPYQSSWVTQTNYSIDFECGTGYAGNLCQNCAEGFGYYHTGCFSCWDGGYHYALFFFKFVFIILLIVFETYGALKKEHSVSKCLIRIYLNHTIYLIAFTGLNLSLDDEFRKLFGQINSNLSIIPSDVFNFHCLLVQTTQVGNIFSANLALQTIIPIIYGSITFFIKNMLDYLMFCYPPKKYKKPNMKRMKYNLIITFYLAYRNWYPRVLMSTMDLFKCIDLGDPNTEYLEVEPNTPCWGSRHDSILIGTILPSIIVWVILVPSLTFYYLRKNRKLLAKRDVYIQENETRRQQSSLRKAESVKEKTIQAVNSDRANETVGASTTGEKIKKGESIFFYWTIDYQKKFYLWVVIENIIAFSLLFISQVISGLEDKIQRMIMFICFAVLFLMYQKLEPFEQKINNTIASFSIAMALFTIIFQMIGANENNSPSIMDFSVGMIIFCNMFFYIGALIVVILYRHKETRKKIYGVFRGLWRYCLSFCKR